MTNVNKYRLIINGVRGWTSSEKEIGVKDVLLSHYDALNVAGIIFNSCRSEIYKMYLESVNGSIEWLWNEYLQEYRN